MRDKVRKIEERVGEKGGGKRNGREESKKASQSVRGWDEEGGSGDYRLSGVFYLWSKCTLAFLLSSPQMQLDSSLAKQTQMKWLLNDFLGNPPRQRKPSIWSLLFPPLSLSSSQLSFPYFTIWFSACCRLYFDLLTFSFPLDFSCLDYFHVFHLWSCHISCLFWLVILFACLYHFFPLETKFFISSA